MRRGARHAERRSERSGRRRRTVEPGAVTVRGPRRERPVTPRVLLLGSLAIAIGIAAGVIAQVLTRLIGLITNLAFYGRLSTTFASPADNHLGAWVVVVPVIGALLVGFMARYGSAAIRGHGIPEAMEQVLFNRSRIAPRLTILKPLSAALSIGTGGPFGAEGPIIATGGALGSLVGQVLTVTADERKILVAAGAAAGMAATFGAPVAAVLLAIELLLFEYRGRSLVPVAFASVAATGVRALNTGTGPMFTIPPLGPLTLWALAGYGGIGAAMGVAAVVISRLVYRIEDAFDLLPLHWMWWPALGGFVVGTIGWLQPHTLGVGYDVIESILDGSLAGNALLLLCACKLASWAVALGSGTSGGTLAPLFTLGGGLGALAGAALASAVPGLGVDPRVAALVGMAALFAGASRAVLASVVFAFELTQQPLSLLPLLGGCGASFLIASLLSRTSIMTEKLARRGVQVPSEYEVDFLARALVRDHATMPAVCLHENEPVAAIRSRMAHTNGRPSHQGFPVVDAVGDLRGVVTWRDLFAAEADGRRVGDLVNGITVVAFDNSTLREAADLMVREAVGRLPVVSRSAPRRPLGMLTRSDLLVAHRQRLSDANRREHGLWNRKRTGTRRDAAADVG